MSDPFLDDPGIFDTGAAVGGGLLSSFLTGGVPIPSLTGGAGGPAVSSNRSDPFFSSPFVFTSIGGGGGVSTMAIFGVLAVVAWIAFRK